MAPLCQSSEHWEQSATDAYLEGKQGSIAFESKVAAS